MKRIASVTLGLLFAATLMVHAGEGKTKLTDEQKAVKQELLTKYDTNKDGKLDKEERAKISKEDKVKLEKAGLAHKKKDGTAPAGQ